MTSRSTDDHRVADLAAQVEALRPRTPREASSRRRILAMLDWLVAPFDEHADPAHVTGSAVVLDEDRRVLLHRHKRLGRWLQPGGHLDEGETPAAAAVRETHEETGLEARHPSSGPCLVHVDVHEGPRGHVHLDLRYLLWADGNASLRPHPGESPDVGWFTPEAAWQVGDVSLAAAIDAAIASDAT